MTTQQPIRIWKIVVTLVVASLARGVGASPSVPSAPALADEQTLRQLKEELWPRAYREGDVALLDQILASEYQRIGPDGKWSSKADELAYVANHKMRNQSFHFEIRRLEVFDNGTAVVAGQGVVKGPESDPGGGYEYQSSNILIRREGRWQAIASHVSGVTKFRLPPAVGACPPPPWSKDELVALADRGFTLADEAGRNRLAEGLVGCLDHPDPQLRDQVAFSALSHWLRAGELTAPTRSTLFERVLPRLAAVPDPDGVSRSFAALTMSELVRADRLSPALEPTQLAEVTTRAVEFLAGIRDYRGFDPEVGWRHAVAHGADLALQLGVHPRVAAADQLRLLEALGQQIAPEGDVFFQHGEPERFARTVYFIHQRAEVPDATWDRWFASRGDPAPFASWTAAQSTVSGLARRHNVMAFLHAVAFAARANPLPAGERLAALADRELTRIHGG